ncbi:hypothetical protein Dimus_028947 [Dionaea muscipula]
MATLLRSDSRNLYSWWWDSHNSPKNSKWLQGNLRDMDAKVKAMIKLIEEDADSFARRAEMYYKKRPELMKLVEEFYRAYRALAERYDHATGELRQAHKTIAAAFPNEVPFMLTDDAPLSSEESDVGLSQKCIKQLNEMFQSAEAVPQDSKSAEEKLKQAMEELEKGQQVLAEDLAQLSNENEKLKTSIVKESDRACKAEMELQKLKDTLAKTEVERDAVFLQYQQSLEKLSNVEKALTVSQKCAEEFDHQVCKAESEIKALKETLFSLEAEKDATLLQYRESLDQVVSLETRICTSRDDAKHLNERAIKAETESKILREELSRSELQKGSTRLLYEQCLEKISAMENQISLAEGNAKMMSEQNIRTKDEVEALKEELLILKQEKDDAALRYEHCLQKISMLQNELTEAQEEARRLNGEILLGSAKLRGAEEQCALLGKVNQSLQLEATNLAQKIEMKDQELSQKQAEKEKLEYLLENERSQFMQVEATLQTLQNLHSRSQEEHRALAMELTKGVQTLKDLEMGKWDLEVEIQRLREENRSLNDLTLSSSISEQNLQNEITNLKAIKEKLEGEIGRQAEQTDILERQAHHLKGEMGDLCKRYQDLIQQVQYAGLEPSCLVSSIKDLQEENSRLKGSCSKDRAQVEVLLKKLDHMEELLKQHSILESTLSDVSGELERSKEKMKMLQDSSLLLTGERSALVAEKAALLSQLQEMAESMQKTLEQNAVLEISLAGSNAELEGLRAKSKSLEEYCQLASSERSRLSDERNNLISRLENIELKLENLQRRFTRLEDKHADLEKEKQSTLNLVEELRVSLGFEKQERACLVLTSDARFSELEDHVHHLQEENRCRKNDFEVQLDKAVSAQVEVFILQRFMQDMEEKNYSLLVECQKHIEEKNYSEKLIAELEGESMMNQVESEVLLDKIGQLRTGIYQVLKALEISHVKEAEMGQNFLPSILSNIKDIRSRLLESKDENQQLVIENSILTTLLRHLNLEGMELALRYEDLAQDYLILTLQRVILENEKYELLERRRRLELEVTERGWREGALKVETENLQTAQGVIQMAYAALQEEHLKGVEGNHVLLKELSALEEGKHNLEEGIKKVLVEAIDFSIQAVVFKNWGIEKALELDSVSQDMDLAREAYINLEGKDRELVTELEMMGLENLHLKEYVEELEAEQYELHGHNSQLNHQVLVNQKFLNEKESELSEVRSELKSTRDMNIELSMTVKAAEKEYEVLRAAGNVLEEKILELSEHRKCQGVVIEDLQVANQKLEAEVVFLKEEIEECKTRQEILSLELQERNSEFELWEAEAASFYFDLQICGIKEVLFQHKVQELSGTCEDLVAVNSRKSMEIKQMKEKLRSLEIEVGGLKTQLAAYVPAIASLKDNLASLEQNPSLHRNFDLYGRAGEQVPDKKSFLNTRDQASGEQDGLLELQKLQNRIKLVENILVEEWERVARQGCLNADTKLQAAMKGVEDLKLMINAHSEKYVNKEKMETGYPLTNSLRSPESVHETGPETSESRTGNDMKHIQQDLASDCSSYDNSSRRNGHSDDRMLKSWDAVEDYAYQVKIGKSQNQTSLSNKHDILYHDFEIGDENTLNPTSESQLEKELGVDKLELSRNVSYANQEETMKNILERLASDANKLMELQVSVQELRKKMETNKRSSRDIEFRGLRDQLLDVENSVIQLVDTNTELMKSVEDRPSTSDTVASMEVDEAEKVHRKRVAKQVQRGSEKIGRLQLEVQKIQLVLLKLDGENKRAGRSRFSKSHTGILLRNFVYCHGRSRRQNKSRFCGCLRPSAREN